MCTGGAAGTAAVLPPVVAVVPVALGMAADDLLDLARVEVDTRDGEHVVDAAKNAALELGELASAGAGRLAQPDSVAGPVADQGRAPAAQVGGDQLAIGGHLEDELGLDQVEAAAGRAAEAGGT